MSHYRILSTSDAAFETRVEAGRLLADELKSLAGQNPVVIGIPRGGLIPAREIARALHGDLDIVLSHKLGAPGNPELAIGAVVEGGKFFLDEDLISRIGEDDDLLRQEKTRQLAVISERAKTYRAILAKMALKDRIVIITDDGVARGLTMKAALWAARQEKPSKLIAAVPVAPEENIAMLSQFADEVLCLRAPFEFFAIGQFYVHFEQISDEEVMAILKEEAERRRGRGETKKKSR